ncbi:MAG: hypothetical protein QM680_13510 [Luteolibacter sp.]
MRRGLRHDPKVIALSRHLVSRRDFMDWWSDPVRVTCHDSVTEIVTFANVTRVTVCALLDVWAALNETVKKDGVAPFMALPDIDDIAEIPGFGEAMESVGWVNEMNGGGLEFPRFSEHNTPAKERAGSAKTDAQRAKEYRERKRDEQVVGKAVTASRHVTVEKRREEKSTLPSKSPVTESDEWSDDLPTSAASDMDQLQSRINGLNPAWKKRPHFSHLEQQSLMANRTAWLSVEEPDWKLLTAYMFAEIPDEWRKDTWDFVQPDSRKGLINIGPSAVLSHADQWKRKCEKEGRKTGIEN